MKKTIIRIVAVAMLALMVLTALPAFAYNIVGTAAAQTPVYKDTKGRKVELYVSGPVTINRQDNKSGMYNVTVSYDGKTYTGWVYPSAISGIGYDKSTIELCLEGHRYYDIIRWKEGKMFEQPFLGMYFPGLTQGSGDNRYDVFDMNDGTVGDTEKVDICIYTGKKPSVKNIRKFYKLGDEFVLTDGDKGNIICHDIEKEPRQWREDRDYLYPIPTQERLLSNGTLSQNPNWDDGLDF